MADDEFTVEALATLLGTKVSTIRLYQREGLLHAPTLRGRIAFYGPEHVARLRLVARLQDRGFSLAAIGALVATWESGGSIDDLVGLEGRIAGPSVGDDAVVSVAEFAAMFPAGDFDPELAVRAVELGLVRFEPDGGVRLTSRRFLEIGTELGQRGVSLAEILDQYAATRAACLEMADRFVGLFTEHIWAPFAEREYPADDAPRVAADIDRFRDLGVEIVDLAFRLAIDEAAATAFVDEAGRIKQSEAMPRSEES